MGELFAERPVLVIQRHAYGRVSVQHLFGGDDLDLVQVDVEAELLFGNLLAGIVDALQCGEVPVRAFVETVCHGATLSLAWRR